MFTIRSDYGHFPTQNSRICAEVPEQALRFESLRQLMEIAQNGELRRFLDSHSGVLEIVSVTEIIPPPARSTFIVGDPIKL